jgi:hypothetical protein
LADNPYIMSAIFLSDVNDWRSVGFNERLDFLMICRHQYI